MGASEMIKKILLTFFVLNFFTFSQVDDLSVDHKAYPFLERMAALHLITDFNAFEIPFSRNKISNYLSQLNDNIDKLNEIDKKILSDLLFEFQIELKNSDTNFVSLLGSTKNYNPFENSSRRFFYYEHFDKTFLAVNLIGFGTALQNRNNLFKGNALLIGFGGQIRGSVNEHFGFFIEGTNGRLIGDKKSALAKRELVYNYKFNEAHNVNFYDETRGYIRADFDFVNFKFGRDRKLIGHGIQKEFISDNSQMFDFIEFNLHYSNLSFSYFHGKLHGRKFTKIDSVSGGINTVENKFIGYHRIGFNPSSDFQLGVGEMIIYANRSIDLGYLNPFVFYKTIEHENQDRDNSILFLDLKNNSIKGVNFFLTLLIDDLSAGKIGKGWWGNQVLWNFSTSVYEAIDCVPIDFHFEYSRIEPYVFTHRLNSNNFTNSSFNLSQFNFPNSHTFYFQADYRISNRINGAVSYDYTVHGANLLDANGIVIKNVGGDVNLGHRTQDATEVKFLDGVKNYYKRFVVYLRYEPFNDFFINFQIENWNQKPEVVLENNRWFFQLNTNIKI